MIETQTIKYRIPETINDLNMLSKEECFYLYQDYEQNKIDLDDNLFSHLATLMCMYF